MYRLHMGCSRKPVLTLFVLGNLLFVSHQSTTVALSTEGITRRVFALQSSFLGGSVPFYSIGRGELTKSSMTASTGTPAPTPAPATYNENDVPQYDLPELLQFSDGSPVQSSKDWKQRRVELLDLFRDTMYGTCPEQDYSTTSCQMSFDVLSTDEMALDGIAIRKEIQLNLTGPSGATKSWVVLLYLPKDRKKETGSSSSGFPCFLGLNFAGNHAIHPDPGITKSIIVEGEEHFECERGGRTRKWQLEKIIGRGFALATVYSGEIEPDNPATAYRDGVHKLFTNYDPSSWGTIAAWSWGLSRTLDLLTIIPEIDETKVAIIGHSRKGKAALWAGAEDPRFSLVISNNSGCGGAAISRRKFGETLGLMNKKFPTWLCSNNRKYTEEILPIDQHELIALMAPRPVYVASAVDDLWADPKGEFQSAKCAEPVYKLLGCTGFDYHDAKELSQMDVAPIDKPLQGPKATVGYHCRTGDHDVLAYDWDQYLDFAEKKFKLT